MLIAICPICSQVIQAGDKAVMFEDYLGRIKQLAHEDCYVDVEFAEHANADAQAFYDSSRGVGI